VGCFSLRIEIRIDVELAKRFISLATYKTLLLGQGKKTYFKTTCSAP
jgi:hypothetical protein